MPCSDGRDNEETAYQRNIRESLQDRITHLTYVIDVDMRRVEAMLCALCCTMESNSSGLNRKDNMLANVLKNVLPSRVGIRGDEINEWYQRHKVLYLRGLETARQEQQKQKRQAALAKLTPEEQQLLGIA